MIIAQTPRLCLRHLTLQDAAFVLELMNQPAYYQYIGDRGLRDIPEAMDYIQTRFIDNYQKYGYGLFAVMVQGEAKPVGICGLVKRDHFPDADLGFAFLSEHWSKGYAREAAQTTLFYAHNTLQMKRLLAITTLDNGPSIRLLEKVGFEFQKVITIPGDDVPLNLYAFEPQGTGPRGAGQV